MPKDVVQVGAGGDNADFYLPGTQNGGAVGGGCTYWGPAGSPVPAGLPPDCRYTGTSPPASPDTTDPAAPGAPATDRAAGRPPCRPGWHDRTSGGGDRGRETAG